MSISQMYFNYDNDNMVLCLPVLPEELPQTFKAQGTSVQIDQFGEATHKGKRDAAVIKFSSFFPPYYDPYVCACPENQFRPPEEWNRWMLALIDADNPFHFVYTNSPAPINMFATITSYIPKEAGGDPGTIQYTIEIKEYRNPSIRKYTWSEGNSGAVSEDVALRVDNAAQSYNYRCTAAIGLNLRTGPWGGVIGCIPCNVVVMSDGTRDGDWIHVCYNGAWGYANATYLAQC